MRFVIDCFFFFKQKTAYEMRISDWSSDVCSSDLEDDLTRRHGAPVGTTLPRIRESVMAWAVLFVAGLLEVGWAVGLKYTEGFTRLAPSIWTAAAMVASMGMLGLALNTLPLGPAYALWTGRGPVGPDIGSAVWRERGVQYLCISVA